MAPDDFPRGRPAPLQRPARTQVLRRGLAWSHVADLLGQGLQASAVWSLLWNNPKLHTPERRKSWLACDEHRTTLGAFLEARGFLRDIEPIDESTGIGHTSAGGPTPR